MPEMAETQSGIPLIIDSIHQGFLTSPIATVEHLSDGEFCVENGLALLLGLQMFLNGFNDVMFPMEIAIAEELRNLFGGCFTVKELVKFNHGQIVSGLVVVVKPWRAMGKQSPDWVE